MISSHKNSHKNKKLNFGLNDTILQNLAHCGGLYVQQASVNCAGLAPKQSNINQFQPSRQYVFGRSYSWNYFCV
jgi:hypothetical protein